MARPIKKGDRLIHGSGTRGVAGADQSGSSVPVTQQDGAIVSWPVGTFQLDPLADFIEYHDPRNQGGDKKLEPPNIDPKKYGYETEGEYWDDMRRLAGLPSLKK